MKSVDFHQIFTNSDLETATVTIYSGQLKNIDAVGNKRWLQKWIRMVTLSIEVINLVFDLAKLLLKCGNYRLNPRISKD